MHFRGQSNGNSKISNFIIYIDQKLYNLRATLHDFWVNFNLKQVLFPIVLPVNNLSLKNCVFHLTNPVHHSLISSQVTFPKKKLSQKRPCNYLEVYQSYYTKFYTETISSTCCPIQGMDRFVCPKTSLLFT